MVVVEKEMGTKFYLTCPQILIECLSHARLGPSVEGTQQMEHIFKEQVWDGRILLQLLLWEGTGGRRACPGGPAQLHVGPGPLSHLHKTR